MTDSPPSPAQPQLDVATAVPLPSTPRSVPKRLDFDRPVEREVILECLELAVQAPTASNRQTWRWVVVTDAELKAKIADVYRAQGLEYLSSSREAAEESGDATQLRVYESAVYLAEN